MLAITFWFIIKWFIIFILQFKNPNGIFYYEIGDIILYVCHFYMLMTTNFLNQLLMFVGWIDFSRKLFYMKLMTALIDTSKNYNSDLYCHYMPTLNVLDYNNIRRWHKIRTLSLDFGKKYTYRIFVYWSVLLVFFWIMGAYLLLWFFKIVKLDLTWPVYVIASTEILMSLGILFWFIILGAKINSYFDIHKGILLQLKISLWEVKKRYSKRYSLLESKTSFNSRSVENLVKFLKTYNYSKNQRNQAIDEAIEAIDIVIQKLEFEKENEEMKILGIKLTNQLVQKIYTGAISLLFIVAQYLFSNGFNVQIA